MPRTMNQILKTANKPSLYIHIPFCSHLCHYCDFTKFFYQKQWIDAYLNTLEKEIASFNESSFLTIYIGGGTPTSLSKEELNRLLEIVKPYSGSTIEFSVECNIESTIKEKLELMMNYGVDRLSFGVQSTSNTRLEEIGRKHTYEDAVKIIDLAKSVGFTKMSVDLIYGLPGQTLDEVELDLENILKLGVNHIATYSLTIHPHTKAYIDKWPLLSDDRSRDFYDLILNKLRSASYERYEVSNFAKVGHKSIHNHVYWYSLPFYGAGYGASGYLIKDGKHYRYRNIGKFNNYLNGEIEKDDEWLDEEKHELEYLMNNLRLKQGFNLEEYDSIFQTSFMTRYDKKLKYLLDLKLLNLSDNIISCTDEGLIKLDYILFKLM